MQVNLYEAKTRLSELVEQARQGQTVVIAKNGTPLAKLVPLDFAARRKVVYGSMKGEFIEADDFDDPLPDEVLALFEGGEPAAVATEPAPPACAADPLTMPKTTPKARAKVRAKAR